MIENEFTYLVKRLPDNLDQLPHESLKQGYFSAGLQPLRIRQKGARFELTKKVPLDPNDYSRYQEYEIGISQEEFERLWTQVLNSLEKTRYYTPLEGGLKAELDVFEGALKGLSLVEVEFPTEEARTKFQPPEWFGKDVTQEHWACGAYLAGKSFEDIKSLLRQNEY